MSQYRARAHMVYLPGTIVSRTPGRLCQAKERFHSPIRLHFHPVSLAVVFVILHHIRVAGISEWMGGVQLDNFVAGSEPILYPSLVTVEKS